MAFYNGGRLLPSAYNPCGWHPWPLKSRWFCYCFHQLLVPLSKRGFDTLILTLLCFSTPRFAAQPNSITDYSGAHDIEVIHLPFDDMISQKWMRMALKETRLTPTLGESLGFVTSDFLKTL